LPERRRCAAVKGIPKWTDAVENFDVERCLNCVRHPQERVAAILRLQLKDLNPEGPHCAY